MGQIQNGERIKTIDVIRGFSILGIFFVNMQDFSSPWLYLNNEEWFATPLNNLVRILIDIFAQASFYTLFSFLFGFGFVIFKERAEQKELSFRKLFFRRLMVLLLIGLIHAFLIWHGDILISYALTGLILMLFLNRAKKTMFLWSMGLFLIPSLLFGVTLFVANIQSPELFLEDNKVNIERSLEIYAEGSYIDITDQRFFDWFYVHGGFGIFFVILSLLPMFLLGAYVAQKRWFHNVGIHKLVITKWWVVSFVVSIVTKTLPYWVKSNVGLEYIQESIGGPATAIFYATSIALLMDKKIGNKLFSSLSFVGRMSLSNYLFQSVICTLIFYGYGFGLYGKVSPFLGSVGVILIFKIQLVLSKKWLSYYHTGPVEWVWRMLTYGQRFSLKK